MTTLVFRDKVPYTLYSNIPAWDEHYLILPGKYVVTSREYFPGQAFEVIEAQVEVVSAKKRSIFCGVGIGEPTGPEPGEVLTLTIAVSKIRQGSYLRVVR